MLLISDRLMSDADFIKGEDDLSKEDLRTFSSASEGQVLSEGEESGFSCGGLDDTCSGREGGGAWSACLVDDRENRLRGIASRRYFNRSCLMEN